MPNAGKFGEKSMKKVGSFSDHSWDRLFMDFGAILAPSWEPKCSQNRYKRVLKNDEKMMITRMARKLDFGGYACARNHHSRARGGGKEEG